MEDGSFKINLSENHLKAGDNFTNGVTTCQALESPKRKWYKVIWQYLSFGHYKAPYEYRMRLVKFHDIDIIDSLKPSKTNLYVVGIDEYDKNSKSHSKGNI